MPLVRINEIVYHYTIAGPAILNSSQLPLVLLHGFTGSGTNWRTLSDRLPPTMPIITIDLLGHGQTDAPADPARYRMAAAAQDLVDLLAVVAPGPVNLLGYSMGGRLALYLALTYPHLIDQLILESASPGLTEATARAARIESDEALADRIAREGIPAFVEYWEAIPLFASQQTLPAAIRQQSRDHRLHNRSIGLANSLRGMGTGVQPPLWDQLANFSRPTLLLTGALDQKFCAIAQQMAARLPTANHLTIPHAGHTIHLEQPDAWAAAISTFLLSA